MDLNEAEWRKIQIKHTAGTYALGLHWLNKEKKKETWFKYYRKNNPGKIILGK